MHMAFMLAERVYRCASCGDLVANMSIIIKLQHIVATLLPMGIIINPLIAGMECDEQETVDMVALQTWPIGCATGLICRETVLYNAGPPAVLLLSGYSLCMPVNSDVHCVSHNLAAHLTSLQLTIALQCTAHHWFAVTYNTVTEHWFAKSDTK